MNVLYLLLTNSEGKEDGGEEMATFDDSDGVSLFHDLHVSYCC